MKDAFVLPMNVYTLLYIYVRMASAFTPTVTTYPSSCIHKKPLDKYHSVLIWMHPCGAWKNPWGISENKISQMATSNGCFVFQIVSHCFFNLFFHMIPIGYHTKVILKKG